MKKSFALFLSLLMLLSAMGVLVSADSDKKEPEKLEPITIGLCTDMGGVDDKSFNQGTWEGVLRYAEEQGLPEEDYQFVQALSDADYIPQLTTFAEMGKDLIVAPGFLFNDAITEVANDFPEQKFLFLDDVSSAENVLSAVFSEHEGSFLVGVAAALKADADGKDKVGFVGGMDFPTIQKFESGFEQGVKAVNPEIEVLVEYVGAFDRPEDGQTIATKLYDAGCYILFQAAGGSGNGVIKEARDRTLSGDEVFVIGVDKDQYEEGIYEDEKSIILTSMVKRVGVAAYTVLGEVARGEFEGGVRTFTLKDDGVGIPEENPNLEKDWLDIIEVYRKAIVNEIIEVPELPVRLSEEEIQDFASFEEIQEEVEKAEAEEDDREVIYPTVDPADLKIGFIHISDPSDMGYTYNHDLGTQKMAKHFGLKDDQIINKFNISEGAESETAARELAEQGCQIIFGTSFGFEDYMLKVAKDFPEIQFCHATGYKAVESELENFHNYFGDIYQARYLSGIAAGLKTKTNLLGYVTAMPYAECISGFDAFYLGAKSVNPEVKMIVMYTDTWSDPTKESQVAQALIDQGADVIGQHCDSTAPATTAEANGVFHVGYNSDMREAAPKASLTSAIWDWSQYLIYAVDSVVEGKAIDVDWSRGLADGVCDVSELNEDLVAEGTAEAIAEARERIVSGDWDVFTGPLKNNEGEIVVEEGETFVEPFSSPSFDHILDGITVIG